MHIHTINCSHPVGSPIDGETEYPHLAAKLKEQPVTGTGDNPLKEIQVDIPNPNPETVNDYLRWVQFRSEALKRWINSGETRLALETIARLEGDLQQVRTLLKSGKKLAEG